MTFSINMHGFKELLAGRSIEVIDGIHPTLTTVLLNPESLEYVKKWLSKEKPFGIEVKVDPSMKDDEWRIEQRQPKEMDIVRELTDPPACDQGTRFTKPYNPNYWTPTPIMNPIEQETTFSACPDCINLHTIDGSPGILKCNCKCHDSEKKVKVEEEPNCPCTLCSKHKPLNAGDYYTKEEMCSIMSYSVDVMADLAGFIVQKETTKGREQMASLHFESIMKGMQRVRELLK